MSSEITELRDGVRLRKRFEDEEFHLPSVVYEFESGRSDVVEVRVEGRLPDGIGPEHIGFHNEFGRDNWTLTEDSVICEATIQPGGECKAVYALRPGRAYDPERVTTEPDTFTVSGSSGAAVPASQSGSFTRSAGSDGEDEDGDGGLDREVATWDGNSTDSAGTNGGATDGDGAEGEAADCAGANEEAADSDVADSGVSDGDTVDGDTADGTVSAVTDGDGTGGAVPGVDPSTGTASLVDQLVAELRDGTASEESREYLAREFGGGSLPPGSVDARLTQLQADVSDLQSYRTAMEEFLDAYGSPEQVADTLESRLDSVEGELRAVESTAADVEAELSSLRDRLRTVEDELGSMSEELSTVGADVEALSAELSEVDGRASTAEVEERIAEVEAGLDEVCEFTEALEKAIQR